MPVLIPSGLYSSGKFRVDISPLERVVKQREAEKKAANDAATKYFNTLKDKVNTAGVRDVDLQGKDGLNAKINNWVSWGSSNIEKIAKGGADYANFLKGYQTIMSDIDKSKQAYKVQEDLGKFKAEGKYDPDADDLKVLEHFGKSIYDKDFYKQDGTMYGWADLPSNAPQFDANSKSKFLTESIGGKKPTANFNTKRTDENTHRIFVTEEFDNDALKGISDNAANLFYTDKKAQKFYKDILSNKDWLTNAQKGFESVYGTGQIIDTPEKAARAEAIMYAKLVRGETSYEDPAYAEKMKKEAEQRQEQRNKEAANTRFGRDKELIKLRALYRDQDDDDDNTPTYGEYYSGNMYNSSQKPGHKMIFVKDMYEPHREFIIGGKPTDPNVPRPFTDGKGQPFYYVNPDGNWEGEGGRIIDKRILQQKIKGFKSSSISNPNAPGRDVAIAQYPKNIQKGIMAFSQQNNLPLDEALDILKKSRPEIFA